MRCGASPASARARGSRTASRASQPWPCPGRTTSARRACSARRRRSSRAWSSTSTRSSSRCTAGRSTRRAGNSATSTPRSTPLGAHCRSGLPPSTRSRTTSCSPVPELREADVAADPLRQFDRWFAEAGEAVPAPEAMVLATATPDGAPSARMVLLKEAGDSGFVFFTNYGSRKGRELAANPRAALLFHWQPLGRQVRVEGPVERLDEAASDAYFHTRALGARIGAWVSAQSEVIGSRVELESAVETMRQHLGAELERPPHWGGFRLSPEVLEFWQHRDDRLHDRLRYRRDGGGWVLERLAP